MSKADAALGSALDPVAQRAAALKNQTDRPLLEQRRSGRKSPQTVVQRIRPHAIRPADDKARFLAKIFHRLRAFLSFWVVALTETGGVNRRRLSAKFGGFLQSGEHGSGRNQDEQLLRHLKQCRDVRITSSALDLFVVRIDEKDLAAVDLLEIAINAHGPAPLGRSADNRHGARAEKIFHGFASKCFGLCVRTHNESFYCIVGKRLQV